MLLCNRCRKNPVTARGQCAECKREVRAEKREGAIKSIEAGIIPISTPEQPPSKYADPSDDPSIYPTVPHMGILTPTEHAQYCRDTERLGWVMDRKIGGYVNKNNGVVWNAEKADRIMEANFKVAPKVDPQTIGRDPSGFGWIK